MGGRRRREQSGDAVESPREAVLGADVAAPSVEEVAVPPRAEVALALVCTGLALFLAALSQTVLATIMPPIVADLGGFDRYAWPSTAYLVAATVSYPIAGRISDIYGRRSSLIVGIATFAVGAALVGVSTSLDQVIGFRAVQGIGGGIVMTCSYVSIADLFRPDDRGKFYGLLGAVYALATVVGPVMGAVVAEQLSWHWVFLILAFAGVPVLALTAWVYPRPKTRDRGQDLDYLGMAALLLAVVPLALALSASGVADTWGLTANLGLAAFGLAMAAIFAAIELRSRSPIMPLGIYRHRAVSVAVAITLITSASLHGFVLYLPLYFQRALGASTTQAGLLLVPMLLGTVVGAIAGGQLLSRAGARYRAQALVGTALMAAGLFGFSTLTDGGGFGALGPNASSQVLLVITSLGFGTIVSTLAVAVQNTVPFRQVGTATAALQLSRSLGGMIGLAGVGAVMVQSFRSRVDSEISDEVKALLPEGLLHSVTQDAQALVDPAASRDLTQALAEAGGGVGLETESLLASLDAALLGGLGDVFTALWAVVALSFAFSLLLRVPLGAGRASRPTL